jgi:methyltransferase (TIGR00027 family)
VLVPRNGMKDGRGSKTAELVCAGRAIAHQTIAPGRFDDPTAMVLLPEEARREAENARKGVAPKSLKDRLRREYLKTQSVMMAARTVAVDDAIRDAHAPQLVILGAGLDGRAWRLPELEAVSVFEVDHPDTQRDKRERVRQLSPKSQDIRFVPVDFERDELGPALANAGHDETRRTTWVWEGVVMYLSRNDIEATLAVVAQRSAAGSQLIVLYHSPAWVLKLVGFFLKRLGEPLRSAFKPSEMRSLLAAYGFGVDTDRDLPSLSADLGPELVETARRVKHLRLAVGRTRSS